MGIMRHPETYCFRSRRSFNSLEFELDEYKFLKLTPLRTFLGVNVCMECSRRRVLTLRSSNKGGKRLFEDHSGAVGDSIPRPMRPAGSLPATPEGGRLVARAPLVGGMRSKQTGGKHYEEKNTKKTAAGEEREKMKPQLGKIPPKKKNS